MPATAAFDAFYLDARSRLVLQAYALTGDLPAARSAVRDAFVVAWHHWRKVAAHDDPEAYVRPIAWAHAQRRHTARVWHRDRSLDPEVKQTLDALGELSGDQRRVLLLTTLSSGTLADIAREARLSREQAEMELQLATATYSRHREVDPSQIRASLEPLRAPVAEVRLPRAPVIRRSGTARRRGHTTVGVLAACAGLLVVGGLVTSGGDVRPALAADPAPPGPADPRPVAAVAATLDPDDLLSTDQVRALARDGTWTEETSQNEDGDGLQTPCQQARYADPDGDAALARVFTAERGPRRPDVSAVQLTELSASPAKARETYRTVLDWYGACTAPRVQLVATSAITGAGDQSRQFVLRTWRKPARTFVVGVVRTGRVTTTVITTRAGTEPVQRRTPARLAATATNALCGSPGTGQCAAPPGLRTLPPMPVGEVPGMLSEIDLPAVTGVPRPWVGTEIREADANYAASGCARGNFAAEAMSRQMTRSFVIPGADLPTEFGITQVVGAMPRKAARAWTTAVRTRLADCASERLGTTMTRLFQRLEDRQEITVYRLRTEVSDVRSVSYLMALVRNGTAVSQVGFIPAEGVTMSPADFAAVGRRALERLARLPAPR